MKRSSTGANSKKKARPHKPAGTFALEAAVTRLRTELGVVPRDGTALAEAVIAHVAVQLPDTICLVATLRDHDEWAYVVAADTALGADPGSLLLLDSLATLRQALTQSEIFRSELAADAGPALPWWRARIGPQVTEMACASLREVDPNAVLLLLGAPELAPQVDAAIHSVLECLAIESAHAREDGAISVAKRQWEQTVDALDELVLLLDRDGHVLRANRTLERWGLGSVNTIRGADCHAAIHPRCKESSCRLARRLRTQWKRIRSGVSSPPFDINDTQSARSLRVATRSVARTDDAEQRPGESFGVVVVVDITELLRAQTKLRRLNDELERRVSERTAQLETTNRVLQQQIEQRLSAEHDLRRSRDELARLSEELINAQEKERQRTALELHDTVGQALGAVKYTLERFIAFNENPSLGDAEPVLATLVAQLQQAITSTRSLSMSLRPSLLDDIGAVSALRWFCQSFAETHTDLDLVTELQVADVDVPTELAVPVFRIVQEALTNTAKHARARTVLVALRKGAAGLVLEIRDDGIGFNPSYNEWSENPRLGIIGMRERSTASGGSFTIIGGGEAGTQIRVVWPLNQLHHACGAVYSDSPGMPLV